MDAHMKSYTDLDQSNSLAKILPIESVDMCYDGYALDNDGCHPVRLHKPDGEYDTPCWSLEALLDVLPPTIVTDGIESCNVEMCKSLDGHTWYLQYVGEFDVILETKGALIDACYEMIVKLNELKLL